MCGGKFLLRFASQKFAPTLIYLLYYDYTDSTASTSGLLFTWIGGGGLHYVQDIHLPMRGVAQQGPLSAFPKIGGGPYRKEGDCAIRVPFEGPF